MQEFFIENYINNLTINDIDTLAQKNNIFLNENEKNIVYTYLKKYWKIFYKGNPSEIIKDLKTKLQPENFNKGLELYNKYLNK